MRQDVTPSRNCSRPDNLLPRTKRALSIREFPPLGFPASPFADSRNLVLRRIRRMPWRERAQMNITINPFGDWRRVATVEVSSRVRDLPAVVQDDTMKFRLVETESPRRRFRRYDLVVESTGGERRCARTAWAVLTAMREAATHGCIDQFRVIEGDRWLSMFEAPRLHPVEIRT